MSSLSVATYRELTEKYGDLLRAIQETETQFKRVKPDEASIMALDFEREAYIKELGRQVYKDWIGQ